MTRNEYIAETAARLWATPDAVAANPTVLGAIRLADALEAAGVAPWQTAPATDTAAKVVEAAVGWHEWVGNPRAGELSKHAIERGEQ